MSRRIATIKRETNETSVNVEFDVDGKGDFEITTGIRMFDHLLTQLARHGAFNMKVAATGADPHHLVEDVAICLGRAFNLAIGGEAGHRQDVPCRSCPWMTPWPWWQWTSAAGATSSRTCRSRTRTSRICRQSWSATSWRASPRRRA